MHLARLGPRIKFLSFCYQPSGKCPLCATAFLGNEAFELSIMSKATVR